MNEYHCMLMHSKQRKFCIEAASAQQAAERYIDVDECVTFVKKDDVFFIHVETAKTEGVDIYRVQCTEVEETTVNRTCKFYSRLANIS